MAQTQDDIYIPPSIPDQPNLLGKIPNLPGTVNNEQYVIKRTRQPYTGLVLMFAGRLVTAPNGTYEGNFSRELEQITQNQPGDMNNTVDKIIRKFQAPRSPRYYKPDGTLVPIGYRLHQHESNIIHSEHSDIKGSVTVVTRLAGSVNGGGITGGGTSDSKPPKGSDPVSGEIIIDDPGASDQQQAGGGGGY